MTHDPDQLRAPTIDSQGKRKWIYPDRRSGHFARKRLAIAWGLIAIYLLVPFLKIGGRPLLRIDVMESVAYVFGRSFRFADGFYFVLIALASGFLIAWATSLWGRVWCGYGCPQTVFTDWLIRPLEEWIEGPAQRRRLRDQEPFSVDKALRKLAKHGLFALIILVLSNVLLSYFVAPEVIGHWVRSSPSEQPKAFFIMSFVFALLYFDLVWFREQFCSFLCPYGRFQTVLINDETPTVAYDFKRGEPRGKKGEGDCIDCGLCTRVCPTGIDIRQGLQLECIQCYRCVDACHTIMTNLKRPTGLIRSVSERELEGKPKTSRLRIRPLLYFGGFLACCAVLVTLLFNRAELQTTILRRAGTTYVPLEDGRFANYFSLRVVNQGAQDRVFDLRDTEGHTFSCSLCGVVVHPDEELTGNLIIFAEAGWENLSLKDEEGRIYRLPLLSP